MQAEALFTEDKFGVVSHTLVTTKAPATTNSEPPPKRKKIQDFDEG